MAVGTRPVNEVSKAVSLNIFLDTGTLDQKGNPVINRARISGIKENATLEDLYDVAYLYASLTTKSIVDILVGINSGVGPID